MPQAMVVARNFLDMVAALPASKLDMLYDSAFICEAVLRSLPLLAKKYALQMLYVLAPVTATAMEEWVREGYLPSTGLPLISCSNSGSLSKYGISNVPSISMDAWCLRLKLEV
ncbi:hypothetical protein HU200_016569 [Digitaria exilis]|uniref:RNA polymerase II transcription factor B subunit 2 n=1 Tax=Digitaria exilis TaxID=1010633 RepID=A0A835F7K5_9POAL|nr:hypothetical protein HU200_016569 [Digitaria exilis]